MQVYDLIMLIVLIGASVFGAIKGFAWQLASLASIVVSYVVAYRFREDLSKLIDADPPWNLFLAMLILYAGSSFVIWIAFRLLSGVIDKVRLKEFDRHMGALFGFAKGALVCFLITMFAMTLLGPSQQAAICQSRSGYFIAQVLHRADGVLPKEVNQVVGPYLKQLDDRLKAGGVEIDESSPGILTSENGSRWFGSPSQSGGESGAAGSPPESNPPGRWPWQGGNSAPNGQGAGSGQGTDSGNPPAAMPAGSFLPSSWTPQNGTQIPVNELRPGTNDNLGGFNGEIPPENGAELSPMIGASSGFANPGSGGAAVQPQARSAENPSQRPAAGIAPRF